MNKTTVLIILDAFRWDYLNPEDTPCLLDMAEKGVWAQKLISSTGFAQRSAIFCGAPPDVTGNFAMYIYSPEDSPFRFVQSSGLWHSLCRKNWFEYLPEFWPLDWIKVRRAKKREGLEASLRSWIREEGKKYSSYAPPGHVPLEILPFLGLSEDEKPIHEPGSLPVESIFDLCGEQGISVEFVMFPVTVDEDDNRILFRVQSRIPERSQVYMFQFSDPDRVGHHHGTSGPERHQMTREIDRKVELLRRDFEEQFDAVNWLILGDHGMTDVVRKIDIARIVHDAAKLRGLEQAIDYILFLDSTMARLWALTERGSSFIREVLREDGRLADYGEVITNEVAERYRIPVADMRYGDVIWWANPGVLIWPDYFHHQERIIAGMHGYDSYHEDMKGFAIVSGNGLAPYKLPEVSLIDVCPTLCDLIGIAYPLGNEGASMLRDGS